MGRGRGKGKKLTAVSKHDDPGSGGEDSIPPPYRRRGRPQKVGGAKDELDDEDELENVEQELEEEEVEADVKPAKETNKVVVQTGTENGKKRKRQHTQNSTTTDSSNLAVDKKGGIGGGSVIEEPTKSNANAFVRNGSRRKSKPRRAAEAGVECK